MRLDEEPNVEEIICADYNFEAAERLEKRLSKVRAVQTDGRNISEVLEAAWPVNYENGEYKLVSPFNNPEMIEFRGLGPRRMVDHEHEEPVTFGMFFKGLKAATFKYGGPACELAESLYKMGLLSEEPVELNGTSVVPLKLVCKLTPPAPSNPETIKDALSEGMAMEEGATLIRVQGKKDGKPVCFDNYIMHPV
jgi:saccharopine dehydrogenase-like NADP-dependent oxidoreductase